LDFNFNARDAKEVVNFALQQRILSSGIHGSTGKFHVIAKQIILLPKKLIIHASGTIPQFFKRCAVTQDLFDFIIELHPSETSAGLANHIKCYQCHKYIHVVIFTKFQNSAF
jgi:hypothetical protein